MKHNEIIFLLGVMPRSGTNYLANVLCCHEDVSAPEPLWEDFFLSNSAALSKFEKKCFRFWNKSWETEPRYLTKKNLRESMGNGFLDFISRTKKCPSLEGVNKKKLLAKTPTVRGLADFFDYFPNSKLILLVRDGRDIVSSGTKSFGWSFDKAARDWSRAVQSITTFLRDNNQNSERIMLVKYEDLYTDEEATLNNILNFMDLGADKFDFDALNSLGISGSSELVDKQGKVTWNEKLQKSVEFSPVERWRKWTRLKQKRFDYLAGEQLDALGYKRASEAKDPLNNVIQRLYTFVWLIAIVPKTIYELLKNRRFILKSN